MSRLPKWPSQPGPRILTLAGNDLTIDARARKTARALSAAGCSVIAVGLDAAAAQAPSEQLDGALVHRVVPRTEPRLTPRLVRTSPSELVEWLGYETELQRTRMQLVRRDLTARRRLRDGGVPPLAVDAERIAGVLRRAGVPDARRAAVCRRVRGAVARIERIETARAVALQRRYQITSIAYRAAVRAQARQPPVLTSWRRDLPEMHKWEAALGPIVDHLAPDLIHCHDIFHLGLAVRAKARASSPIRVVYDAQEFIAGLPSHPWRRAAYAAMEAEYIHRADGVITVSESLGELLDERYGICPEVVMNAPERSMTGAAEPLREVVGIDDDQTLLVYVGGLAPDRGPELLLDALGYLPADHHLAFVTNATGGYRRTLEDDADRRGLTGRVHFAPYVEPEAVTAYIASADISVIPLSRDVLNYEVALPNKLFQSIQAGVPVVVSDNPEMARFVPHHGIGEVFTGGDPRALARAVEAVTDRSDELRSRLADDDLLDEMSWERQVDTLLTVYASAGVDVQ